MDKYDEAVNILLEKAEPGERTDLKIVLGVVADVARGIEQLGADIDRIATALEQRNVE